MKSDRPSPSASCRRKSQTQDANVLPAGQPTPSSLPLRLPGPLFRVPAVHQPSRPSDLATCAVIAAATLALVAWAALAFAASPGFDRNLMAAAHDLRAPALDEFFRLVTWLGSLAVLVPLAVIASIALLARSRRHAAALIASSLAAAATLSHLAKLAFARPRPDFFPALTAMPADLSFPSAHSAQAAAVAVAAYLVLRDGRRNTPATERPSLATAALVLAVITALVALSRLYLQVHFPSDIVAGLVLGAGCALCLHRFIGDGNAQALAREA